jgi:hypothetical protein
MPAKRMNREEFYAKLAPLDRDQLARAMWNLYWRGSAQFRERIEAELEPAEVARQKRAATQPPDPDVVLAEVTEFTGLARAGAYMYGDRRVTPRERTRWRLTFRRLVDETGAALRAPEPDPVAEALTLLIDLANDARDSDYFHSQDPVEAAGFVLSDAAALLWEVTRDRHGFATFADRAAPQLIRWESRYGWTRSGYGRTSGKETSLACVLASMLRTADMWTGFAERYLTALDHLASAERRSPASKRDYDVRSGGGSTYARNHRTDRLAEWHQTLFDRLASGPEERLLDRLLTHPALSGPELTLLRARLACERDDTASARELASEALRKLPGHQELIRFATEIGAELPVGRR